MISVIIPTYNRGTLLLEAVESVLRQVNVTTETIVVDDGSTDDTAKALQVYGDSIRYAYQSRKGVSAARNLGIRIASGEWLAFLDSDDYWLPRKLSIQMDYLLEHSKIKICQTDEVWIRNGRRVNRKKHHEKPEGDCFGELLERCLVSPSAVVIHRGIFEEVGLFDETLPACEDYDMWLRIGCRFPIGLIREPLIVKRGGHPGQLSATIPALDRYRILSLAKLIREAPLSNDQRVCALDVLRRKCRIYGEGCRRRGRLEEAQSILAIPDAF